MALNSIEICTGGGGSAVGLEQAGFSHICLVEIDAKACLTLRHNRPGWNVLEMDVKAFSGVSYRGNIDLLAGGVPCPPFSVAGKRKGALDDRDLFPEVVRLADEIRPKAIFIENVRGLLDPVFDTYRKEIDASLRDLGFEPTWALLNASDFGVPQLRPRAVLVALQPSAARHFTFPKPRRVPAKTVGEVLRDEMASMGWEGADEWASNANAIAPTLVGGSKLHGGPDLGPTRARNAWAQLGVEGRTLAEVAPLPGFRGLPRLTVKMASMIQGFPSSWNFAGTKTQAYRQVGNAFPPPVARAIGLRIKHALLRERSAGSAAA